ncbi:uncharacterized protein [Lepeophtheirus salmonis]|uniref:uncharacterized protein isoform X2 n=1 Tax=Lepeophtheirus salmonis TaxID=72036 RepID=UPI001AE8FF51|nr:uncharacterized protein LOC121128672 [Lepeophtheirus salmonis]
MDKIDQMKLHSETRIIKVNDHIDIFHLKSTVSSLDTQQKKKKNPQHQKPSGAQYLRELYFNFARNTSAHGFSWTIVDKSSSTATIIYSLLVAIALICVFITVVKSTSEYLFQNSYQTRYDVDDEDSDGVILMPDFIICHSSPWSFEKARKLNISSNLLSYITVALNPYHALIGIVPDRLQIYSELEKEFQNLVQGSFNGNLRNLLDAVTLDCSDFIRICMMGAFQTWAECCKNVFNYTGIYSYDGKCFSTKGVMNHQFLIASSFDAIQIVIAMDKENPYELLNGSIATWSSHSLRGISFALIDENDDPISALYNSDFIDYGVMTRTKIKKITMDRGGINCFNNVGTNYSQRNCKNQNIIEVVKKELSCMPIGLLLTISDMTGIKYCSPMESLRIVNETIGIRDYIQKSERESKNQCKNECIFTTYESVISSQILQNNYYRKYVKKKPSHELVLHTIYFPSFNFGRITHVPKGIVDWLGDVGGNCGFYLGASIFSIFEFFGFIVKIFLVSVLYIFGCKFSRMSEVQSQEENR